MNKNNSLARGAAFVCLAASISACESDVPVEIDDVAAHWTAESLALRDGDAVSVWPDSSANGHDALATASSRPTFKVVDGVPTVQFDGVDDYMTVGGESHWRFLRDGSEWTVLILFKSAATEPGGKHVLLDVGGADYGNSGFTVSYDDRLQARRANAVRLSVADTTGAFAGDLALDLATGNRSFPSGKWGIISAVFRVSDDGYGGEASLWVNGYRRVGTEKVLLRHRSAEGTDLNIGRHSFGDALLARGEIKEIMIYRRALTDDEHHKAVQHLAGRVSPAVRIRTPLTKTWLNFDPQRYQAFGVAFRVPTTGKLVAIQRQGVGHVGGTVGDIRLWESTDRGANWKGRLIYDSAYDDRNVGGGLIPRTGTIVAFFARYDGAHWIDMRALRSIDDAESFEDIGAPLPTNDCAMFSPYGPLVELPSGRLLQAFYGHTGTLHKVWLSESVDDGLTWTFKSEIYRGPLLINESSVAWVSGSDDATSTLVAVARHDGGFGLQQFVSRDGGDTWASQGVIPGGNRTDVSPWLYRLSDGTLINAWHERSWFTFRIRMGLAQEVAASPSSWGQAQVTYHAATRIVGDSGYPAVLSATGWDDDLLQVIYDRPPNGNSNLLTTPIALP